MSGNDSTTYDDGLLARAAAIRVAIFDVDGVITDGKLYLGPDGAEAKTMHTQDRMGFKRLIAAGIIPAVISGRPSAAVTAGLQGLGVEHITMESGDKIPDFEALLAELELTPCEASMMGDDVPDLAIMQRTGLALAVANAVPEVAAAAHWQSTRRGGEGAVREACELLIAAAGKPKR